MRIDPLRLSLTVPQQDVAQIKAGQTVTFQTDAYPGRKFTGTVRYITPAVTSDSRSLCVEAMVPNPGAVLYPGLFVTAELQLDEQQTELYVPQAAVCNRGDVAAVFVVRGGIVREQIVSRGRGGRGPGAHHFGPGAGRRRHHHAGQGPTTATRSRDRSPSPSAGTRGQGDRGTRGQGDNGAGPYRDLRVTLLFLSCCPHPSPLPEGEGTGLTTDNRQPTTDNRQLTTDN